MTRAEEIKKGIKHLAEMDGSEGPAARRAVELAIQTSMTYALVDAIRELSQTVAHHEDATEEAVASIERRIAQMPLPKHPLYNTINIHYENLVSKFFKKVKSLV